MYKTKAIILISAFLFVYIPLSAQDYPFLRTEANQLRYDSTSATMQAFLQKFHRLRTTGQGNVSIMHIGGSHVQAGTFPHRIRTNILSAYPLWYMVVDCCSPTRLLPNVTIQPTIKYTA